MKYNEKYDRWVTTGGLVYRYNSIHDKLVLCKLTKLNTGYFGLRIKSKFVLVHRIVWETFNGYIPDVLEIDHQDTHKDNNALSNLKLCTHKENMNNPISKEKRRKSLIGHTNVKGNIFSEFGKKFKEHYGITRSEDIKLYDREHHWYRSHNHKCRWEMNNGL